MISMEADQKIKHWRSCILQLSSDLTVGVAVAGFSALAATIPSANFGFIWNAVNILGSCMAGALVGISVLRFGDNLNFGSGTRSRRSEFYMSGIAFCIACMSVTTTTLITQEVKISSICERAESSRNWRTMQIPKCQKYFTARNKIDQEWLSGD
ncbi:hypothetical protein [Xanthomonas hortorum]|uniref:hypothetical protein n=1 Tax=Xanthomonas hortorum TaxID=56454 RepID=UPI0015D5DE91|nr:hypothetical protein [Xanthomonas hortorum]MCC8495787.1 hypothetical protein [Xanthomonas hortorum pv. gardneri]MCE4529645.1 hypothetical protein [Xanthomonas hortorum pv. vitians]NMI19917.1 hypothetical protein [Xanthomonas hortorum pv. vitians]